MSPKKQSEEKLSFNQENVKEFIRKWNQGHTTTEITESFKKIGLNIVKWYRTELYHMCIKVR